MKSLKTICIAAAMILLSVSLASADFEQAMNHFKSGKYAEAAAEFQGLVDQSPEYDSGYFMLGQCFVQMSKTDDAVKAFQKAIELNGERFEYHYGLASAYFKSKSYSKVVGSLRTAEGLATDAHKYQLFSLRGFSYASLEKWSEAVDDLEKARAIKSTQAVIDQLARAYYSLGYQDKAVPLMRASLKSKPNNEAVLARTINALMDMGANAQSDAQKSKHYGEALQYAESYAKLKPASFEAQNLVGRAALGSKDYGKAATAFNRAIEKKPDHCYAMVNLGKVHIAQQQWTDAEAILKRGANCAPRMAVIYESLGFAVQKQKRLPEAIDYYRKAYEIKPSESISRLIATCEQNIQIGQENSAMADAEKAQDDAAKKAQEEYDAKMAKQKEWEERRKRDD